MRDRGDTARETTLALRQVVISVERWRLRVAREALGSGASELATLGSLAAQGALTPTEIADRLMITTASATQLIDRLAGNGLVVRVPHHSDRRKVLVELTEAGRRVPTELLGQLGDVTARCTARLDPAERELVLRVLRDIATEIDAISG
ncbi:MAG TPA: MarR family transcriptional regulator [Pseudonocardia sp.]